MNKKYQRYIEFIANDLQPPYYDNMRDIYGLRPDEYEMVLSKVYNQPVIVKYYSVYDINGNRIYYEDNDGYWSKREYDTNGNQIYYEDSNGSWSKKEYDTNGSLTYREDSSGYIEDYR
jgi:hypothetical protein